MDKKHRFSTTQVDFPDDTSRAFKEMTKPLVSEKDLFGDGFETGPHVTILYGIHEEQPSPKIVDIIETYPRFSITLGEVSLFSNDDDPFDVVKVDVISNDLFILRSEFLNNCHYTLTMPEYIPHATIAFVKKGTNDHLLHNPSCKGLTFPVTHISFCGKNGYQRKIMLGMR
jgi:2'-5' RNA ligase